MFLMGMFVLTVCVQSRLIALTLVFSVCVCVCVCARAGPSNRSNSVSSLDLEGESVSELGAGPSGSNGVEALQLLEHEHGE